MCGVGCIPGWTHMDEAVLFYRQSDAWVGEWDGRTSEGD